MPGQQAGEQCWVRRLQMLYQNESQTRARRQALKQLSEGPKSAGGSTNSNNAFRTTHNWLLDGYYALFAPISHGSDPENSLSFSIRRLVLDPECY
jgi:hypothetical protein